MLFILIAPCASAVVADEPLEVLLPGNIVTTSLADWNGSIISCYLDEGGPNVKVCDGEHVISEMFRMVSTKGTDKCILGKTYMIRGKQVLVTKECNGVLMYNYISNLAEHYYFTMRCDNEDPNEITICDAGVPIMMATVLKEYPNFGNCTRFDYQWYDTVLKVRNDCKARFKINVNRWSSRRLS